MENTLNSLANFFFITILFFAVSCSDDDFDANIHGQGTKEDPFIIRSTKSLVQFAEMINNGNITNNTTYYKLTSDIDLNNWGDGTGWIPIGNEKFPFKGVFDGNGHTIKNLKINRLEDYQGLFGYSKGTIKRVNLINTTVIGRSYIGGLAGWTSGNIEECSINGNIIGSTSVTYLTVGGLVGYSDGSIRNCYSVGSVSGNASTLPLTCYIGGLVGRSTGTISNCYTTTDVSGSSSSSDYYLFIGGLAGSASRVSNSLSSNNSIKASGKKTQCGYIAASYSSISNCFVKASTSITGSTQPYIWDGLKVSKTTDMQTKNFYTNTLNWDMEDIWLMEEDGTLPVLR